MRIKAKDEVCRGVVEDLAGLLLRKGIIQEDDMRFIWDKFKEKKP